MKYIYIFVNPESGGRNAWQFIEPNVESIEFSKPVPLSLHIYSIFEGESGNKPGFLKLKKFLETEDVKEQVLVVTAGGDGTVTWVVSEVERHFINFDKLAFGIIPYGTGNDFARALKWNTYKNFKPFVQNLRPLRTYLNKLLNWESIKHDFWSIQITLHPEGKFNKINSKTRKKEDIKDKDGKRIETMKFIMGNYFSIGVESRAGRGFDRHRTNYSCFNRMRYLIEGIKKIMRRPAYVTKQIDRMVTGEDFKQVVFVTDPKEKDVPVLKDVSSLISGNIPSFSGGVDPFGLSRHVALLNLTEEEGKGLSNADQLMGDKKLEFYSYKKLTHLAADLFFKVGKCKRVHVGEGPWKIIFKKMDPNEKCYFQVDGEFFLMYSPKEVEIHHYKNINVIK